MHHRRKDMKKIASILFISALLICVLALASCEIFGGGETITTTNPEHVHEFIDREVKPTCASEGYTEHTCEGCGYVYQDDFVEADTSKHKFKVVETVDPTCFKEGYKRSVCSVCGEEEIETLEPKHTFSDEWTTVKAATCTTEGEKRCYCENCTVYKSETIPVTHNYDMGAGVVTDPTCTSEGYTTYTCLSCGHTKRENYTSKISHEFGEWTKTADPTCTTQGEDRRYCENCSAYEVRYTGYKHDYKMEYIPPTCHEQGCTRYVCQICGDVKIDQYVPVRHTFGDWETYIAPTCSTQGLERRYCTGEDCDAFEERIVEPRHIYDIVEVVAPTKTSSGYTKHSCECGLYYIDDIVSTAGSEGLVYEIKTTWDAEQGKYINTYVVTDLGTCTDTEVVIPYMHNGLVVTGISYAAFKDCDNITAIYLPASITSIGNTSLWNCDNLKLISFEGTLEDWNNISKSTYWDYGLTGHKVVCIDGILEFD